MSIFNWQVASSGFLPDGCRRLGGGREADGAGADVAGLHNVILAEVCWCNRTITLFVIGERTAGVAAGRAAGLPALQLIIGAASEGVAVLSANATGTPTTTVC